MEGSGGEGEGGEKKRSEERKGGRETRGAQARQRGKDLKWTGPPARAFLMSLKCKCKRDIITGGSGGREGEGVALSYVTLYRDNIA